MKVNRIKSVSLGVAVALGGLSAANASGLFGVNSVDSSSAYNSLMLSAQGQPSSITFGQPVSGMLGDVNDFVTESGVPFDIYSVQVPGSGSYKITLSSPTFAAGSEIYYMDTVQQTATPLQGAYVFSPSGQVQYSGTLSQPGQYDIAVYASDGMTGSYTLSLAEDSGTDPVTPGSCGAVDPNNPFVELALNQAPMNCELSSSEPFQLQDQNGGIHYAKGFHFSAPGGPVTINASSSAFTSLIVVFDPSTGQIIAIQPQTLTADFSPGMDAYVLVTSDAPQATGPFTVEAKGSDGGDGGGFGGFGAFGSSSDLASEFTLIER